MMQCAYVNWIMMTFYMTKKGFLNRNIFLKLLSLDFLQAGGYSFMYRLADVRIFKNIHDFLKL